METLNVKAFGTASAEAPLKEMNIRRRMVTPHDVEIEILYCGICHSDLHQVKNEFGGTMYPIVPGHEIVGRVTKIGDHVSKFKVGDLVCWAVTGLEPAVFLHWINRNARKFSPRRHLVNPFRRIPPPGLLLLY